MTEGEDRPQAGDGTPPRPIPRRPLTLLPLLTMVLLICVIVGIIMR